ncbi:uncharacterized protein LOC131669523 [Phymastichus coffea]|uniref:uncharacterized protein LOC131669523 n=1 Tax=Phymastichus coffea TaxID=108790 RepID=UPI00273A8515|nr:uncharacterized protein LOC131669523 [Phymastichus coffea]
MSSAPTRGIVPHRLRRHHHHHRHHQHPHDKCKRRDDESEQASPAESSEDGPAAAERPLPRGCLDAGKAESAESRPKVNPIFLWAAQREQRIVEVRCEDYDKRNRIKLTKTAQGWRSIPRTVLTTYSPESVAEEQPNGQAASLVASRNEEKENSSRKAPTMRHIKKDRIENAAAVYAGRLSEVKDDHEKIKRKRKKHAGCTKNKRRKSDLEQEDASDEIAMTVNWKMKKRKKYDKNKKRKKIRLDKEATHADRINNADKLKIKEENPTMSKSRNTRETADSGDSALAVKRDSKSCLDSSEKSVASIDDDAKRSNFKVIQKSRHFQPRVVLEQLHFPLLPTKKMLRGVKTELFQVEAEESKNIDKIQYNGVAKSNRHASNEPPVVIDVDEAIINNEDLQEILNKLDANHIPIDIDKTKFNLIENNELPRNCTKLGVSIDVNKRSDNVTKSFKGCDSRHSTSEIQNTFQDKRKSRPGSRSLDETIERLEKSISFQKKFDSTSDISSVEVSKLQPKVYQQFEFQIDDKSDVQNVTTTDCSTSLVVQGNDEKNHFKKDIIENSKSLAILKNKPDITVSLVDQEKDETSAKNTVPMSTLPDSQTELIDNEESHHGNLSCNVAEIISPDSKSRVDSPESTVNFSKHEDLYDSRSSETTEVEYYKARIKKHDKSHSDNENYNNNNDNINKNFILRENDRVTYINEVSKESVVDSTKIAIKKSPLNQNKCSEAQAKLSVQPKYQTYDKSDKQMVSEFCCQVSPQPSGLPSSMSPHRRSSSVYLERLLPSPPCSVSCSDDAKNDLTLTSILSISNDNLKSAGAKEIDRELGLANDSEMNSAYEVSIKVEKDVKPGQEKPILQEHRPKLTSSKQENRIFYEEPGEFVSVASDCVFSKRPQSADPGIARKRTRNNNNNFSTKPYIDDTDYIEKSKIKELEINPVVFLNPANQLRELLRTSGHLIPDPLLVPRDYLPLIASTPLTEIPNLLATRPELRLPEALTRPELLTDPDLLVISLAHLQHVLDHGEASFRKPYQTHQPILSSTDESKDDVVKDQSTAEKYRPKLSVKPIGKLMPAPMDLSNNQKPGPKPPLLRVRSGLLKQESEVSSTASSPDDLQLWHPLFGSQKQRQQQQQQHQQQHQQQQQQRQQQSPEQKPHQASWHRTTLTS